MYDRETLAALVPSRRDHILRERSARSWVAYIADDPPLVPPSFSFSFRLICASAMMQQLAGGVDGRKRKKEREKEKGLSKADYTSAEAISRDTAVEEIESCLPGMKRLQRCRRGFVRLLRDCTVYSFSAHWISFISSPENLKIYLF